MFDRIKLRIIKGRQLKPFAVAKVLQEHEDRLKALEGESDDSSSYDLSFVINDGNNALSGATVKIGNVSTTTGSAGGCTLKNIKGGNQSVTVSADEYEEETETISVSEDNTSFTISLSKTEVVE